MSAYLKAITAALVAGLGVAIVGYDNGTLETPEILQAAVAGLTALSAVWAVPNRTGTKA